jgi:carboxyl-terminal processing protease
MTRLALLASLTAVCACGGSNDPVNEDQFAARCVTPRTGTDPETNQPYRDVQGTLRDELDWLRAWTNDLYLWYREVPANDPAKFTSALDYFAVLKTPAKTASGKDRDQFHFTYTTPDWVALSQSGVEASYGAQWSLVSRTPPRKLIVAFVEPGSPAATMGLDRGTEVLTIDGVDLVNGTDTATLNNGISPSALNQSHTFVIKDLGATTTRMVTLVSTSITSTPVQHIGTLPAPYDKVGYMVFNDHIATAEKGLYDAVTKLRDAGITDLVLDLRYNGGGYLAIAAQLAYMIAGPTATSGKIFEQEVFNDQHKTIDPFTGKALAPTPYVTTSVGFAKDLAAGVALPVLSLKRVYVLTGSGTCSASEAVMNGLAGADVEVIQIGATTCGKPYGFFPADNCGTTYFSIQFQGVNAKGFGDYADGFAPAGVFKGCPVADDFTHALGDPKEMRLAMALGYRQSGTCTPPPALRAVAAHPLAGVEGELVKPPWRQIAIMTRPTAP